MTYRELLEFAAKVAGIKATGWIDKTHEWFQREGVGYDDSNDCQQLWNPLNDDGDALRLAVKLNIGVFKDALGVYCNFGSVRQVRVYFDHTPCEYTATRLAIVKAAAEIGKK